MDDRPRVYILARKVLLHNTRIFKQARSLTAAGYDVCVVGIQPRSAPSRERRDGYTIIRLALDPIHVRITRRLRRGARRFQRALLRLPARTRGRVRRRRARRRRRPWRVGVELRQGRLVVSVRTRRFRPRVMVPLGTRLERRLAPLVLRFGRRAREERRIARLVARRRRRRRLRYRLERHERLAMLWLRRRRRAVLRALGRVKRALLGEETPRLAAAARTSRIAASGVVVVALRALTRIGRGLARGAVVTIRAFDRLGDRLLRRAMKAIAWPSRSLAYYGETWRLVTTELPPPDLVHANDLDTLYVAARIARRYRVPLLYDAQELYTGVHTLPRWYRALLRVQELVLLRRVDRLTVVNDPIATVMRRRYRRKIDAVVLNCPPYEAEVGGGPSLRDLFALPDHVPVLVYSGGLSARRGIENTVLSLKHIPAASLVLLGEGALRPELERLIARERLSGRVFFCDFVSHEEVPSLISSADVGIVPYENVGLNHYLGSPSKLFHYIMAGLPVACSDFPFLRSVVGTYELGALFDPTDPRSIANAVSNIVGDRDHLHGIKRNLSVARRRYCWEVEEERLLAVYRSLVAPPSVALPEPRLAKEVREAVPA